MPTSSSGRVLRRSHAAKHSELAHSHRRGLLPRQRPLPRCVFTYTSHLEDILEQRWSAFPSL